MGAEGKPCRNKGRGVLCPLTRAGRVSLKRTRYFDTAEGSRTPVDRLVDQAGRLVTLGVRETAVRLAIDSSGFRRAAGNLQRAAGLSLSAESLRQLVEQEGRQVRAAQGHEQLELDFGAKDCTTCQRPDGQETTRMYAGMDGVMVPVITQREKDQRRKKARERRQNLPRLRCRRRRPLPPVKAGADQGYKEFKIVTLYDQEQKHRWVRATSKDHEQAGKLLAQGANQVRLRQARETVAVADGAEWIWKQMARRVPYLDGQVLDFYHLAQHVHTARRLVFGEQDPAGQEWAQATLHLARHEGFAPFWEQLSQKRAQVVRSRAKKAALDQLMQYVAQRRDLMDYCGCDRRGWDVGSGSTESMCKALTRRLKLRGMRWDRDHAQEMMALETLEQTNSWDAWYRHRAATPN